MVIKVITCLFLITIVFYGCSKCEETTGRTETVSLRDIPGLFPYKQNEKIKF